MKLDYNLINFGISMYFSSWQEQSREKHNSIYNFSSSYLCYLLYKQIDPKPCNPRAGMARPPRKTSQNGSKVFLGGLPSNLTETDLRNFFTQYGKVTEVVIMYDQEKKKSRG